ncbi:hypothetical protein ACTXT7_015935 [Hymenolepis weldensis]
MAPSITTPVEVVNDDMKLHRRTRSLHVSKPTLPDAAISFKVLSALSLGKSKKKKDYCAFASPELLNSSPRSSLQYILVSATKACLQSCLIGSDG